MSRIIQTLFFLVILFVANQSFAKACDESPESLNGYLNSILTQAEKTTSPAQLKQNIAKPLGCLLKIYRDSSGFTKYLAGACLRPLVGGREIAEIKRDHRHEKLLKHLVGEALSANDPLNDPALSLYSTGLWEQYLPFCKDSASQEVCLILFPDTKEILQQSDFLGASSMMLLKSAFQKFSGAPKDSMAKQLEQLYRQVPKQDKLKRRMIDQIYQDLFGQKLSLISA